MRGLERYFEAVLLESAGGDVRPTAEGRQLLNLTLPILAGLESAKEVLHQHRGRPPESITLASGMRMLLEEVGDALPNFLKQYPSVRLKCLHVEDRAIEAMVEHGEANLGLMLAPTASRRSDSTLLYEPAYARSFELITPPRHPLLRKRALRLGDVLRHPLVIGTPGTSSRQRIEELLHREGLSGKLRVAVESNSAAMTFAYVRAGAGIGIAPGYQRGSLGRGLGTRSLGHWLGEARYVFVWLRGAYIPPATRALADSIRAAVAEDA
jgi:LysR family cys regulon transcriptional activator